MHPSARWWVKADGCDIVSGLEESLRNEWNGDVDLGTGELQVMYQKYLDHLKRISSMVTSSVQDVLCVLLQEKVDLAEDLQFVSQGKSILVDYFMSVLFCIIELGTTIFYLLQHCRQLTTNTQRRFSQRGPSRKHSVILLGN